MSPLLPIRGFVFVLSFALYCLGGQYNESTFPWFVGDTFTKFEVNMDFYDGFEIFMISGWLIVFVGISYFIYIDSQQKLWYSIIYIVGIYQYIITISIEEYYENMDYLFMKYINYLSGLILLGTNAYIFSMNKYLLPTHSLYINVLLCHLILTLYLALFLYETIYESIFNAKFVSKMSEIILFYGSIIFLIKYKPYSQIEQERENKLNKKIDEILYNMRIEVRNKAMVNNDSRSLDELDDDIDIDNANIAFML